MRVAHAVSIGEVANERLDKGNEAEKHVLSIALGMLVLSLGKA